MTALTHIDTTEEDEQPPDGWPAIAQLIVLAFHDDADFAAMASKALLDRLDLPAIPLALEDGRRKVVRRGERT